MCSTNATLVARLRSELGLPFLYFFQPVPGWLDGKRCVVCEIQKEGLGFVGGLLFHVFNGPATEYLSGMPFGFDGLFV